MFDFFDFADRIGQFDDCFGRVTAGENQIQRGRLVFDQIDDVLQGNEFEINRYVDFIEDDHVVFSGGDCFFRQFKALPGQLDIHGGGVIAHDEAVQAGSENGQARQIFLGGHELAVVAAFHKLHDKNFIPLADGAKRLAESGSGLSLAVAGNHDDQTAVAGVWQRRSFLEAAAFLLAGFFDVTFFWRPVSWHFS